MLTRAAQPPQADKHSIAARCAIPLRDLRILDVELTTRCAAERRASSALPPLTRAAAAPQLLHGAAVSRAHHRHQPGARQGARSFRVASAVQLSDALRSQMIVTADEALVPNAELAEASAFAETLAARLRGHDGGSVAHGLGGKFANFAQAHPLPPRARSAEDLVRLAEQSAAPAFAPLPPPPPHHFHPHTTPSHGAAAAVHMRAAAALPHIIVPTPPPPPVAPGMPALQRPPVLVSKPWLCITATGAHRSLLLDKHAMAHRCGVPLRDLRVLDVGLTTRCVVLR